MNPRSLSPLLPAGHHPSLPLPRPIPDPNPNPNFFFPNTHLPHPQTQPPLPPPPPPQGQPPLPPPPPTLSSTLSSLAQLISLSHEALTSLTSQIALQFPPNPDGVRCPYNPNHIVPCDSLFLHSLQCHSFPLPVSPSSLLQSLHYPKTLNPGNHLPEGTLKDPDSEEIRLSLAGYYKEFASNFFYNDCPAVVCLNELDFPGREFALPRFLCSECGGPGCSREDFGVDGFGIVASDLWFVGREVDGWVDFPGVYSYGVSCALLRLDCVAGSDLGRWVISGSLCYGVVIDVYMRDHVSLLFKLCLRAIRREAMGTLHNLKHSRFECPVLVRTLMWISHQLAVLYGPENAKSFVLRVFKQCVLEAANKAVVVCLKMKSKEGLNSLGFGGSPVLDAKIEENLEGSIQHEDKAGKAENETVILLSQVVAAVAALHERFFLEQKIRKFQASALPPAYQRMTEHDYVFKRADEERKRRPTFITIIDHDGLLRRRLSNQETSDKTKTREELLAEERDYKRRRMSYRGKKSKRTTLEVMRDVIEEYMEEIKEAGGIGCFEKGIEDAVTTASDSNMDHDRLEKSHKDSDHYSRCKGSRDNSLGKHDQWQQDHPENHEEPEHRRANQNRHSGVSYSKGSGRKGNDHRSHKQSSHQREWDDFKRYRSKHPEKISSSQFSHSGYKSTGALLASDDDLREQKDDRSVTGKGRNSRNLRAKHDADCTVQNIFEDRYDPTYS